MLLATAFVAISMAGVTTTIKMLVSAPKYDLVVSFLWAIDRLYFAFPFFVPVIFDFFSNDRSVGVP